MDVNLDGPGSLRPGDRSVGGPSNKGLADVQAAVFDLDGTLVLSEARNRAVWTGFFDAHGVEVDEALLAFVTGRRGEDSLTELAHLFPGWTLDGLADSIREVEGRLALPAVEAVPGAVAYVQRLHRAGVPLALVTSARGAHAAGHLQDTGLAEALAVRVVAEDVQQGKPHPEGYLAACDALRVEPACAVAFEDSAAGVAAVKAAGMYCVALTTTHEVVALDGADLIVSDLSTLVWPPLPAST
ncbi:MAG: HAD family hydrolase [Actinomycetes bacterium]